MSVSARLCSCLAPHAYTIWLNKQIHQCNMLNLESVAFYQRASTLRRLMILSRERERVQKKWSQIWNGTNVFINI